MSPGYTARGNVVDVAGSRTGTAIRCDGIMADADADAELAKFVAIACEAHYELVKALKVAAQFIENVGEEDPERTAKFFAVREAWRNALAKVEP